MTGRITFPSLSKNLLYILFFCFPGIALAESVSDTQLSEMGTILVVLIAAPLVFFMQMGFALLESGMSRAKNAVNVIIKNYCDVCFGSLLFFFFGYGLMFGDSVAGFAGASKFLLNGTVTADLSFFVFQTLFAATAATIMSGAMAERTNFVGYIAASSLVMGFVYPIFGHWAWADGGWLKSMGFIDFAGATVVHSIGGWAALAGIIIVKARMGRFGLNGEVREIPGHNAFYVACGGLVLWFGWFGFNAGSHLAADHSLGKILTNTHLSACAGVVGMTILSVIMGVPVKVASIINGCLGGLVGITAGCATMAPEFAVLTGFLSGFVVLIGSETLKRFQIDDVVDAVPVHAMCGAWGTIAAGMFLEENLLNFDQIGIQLLGVGCALIWGFGVSYMLIMIVNLITPVRAIDEHQRAGLDHAEHSEVGYPEFQSAGLHQ